MSPSGSDGRNRVAHAVAHGRALGHRPGVRVHLRSRGSRSSPGDDTSARTGFSRYRRTRSSGSVVLLQVRVHNLDPQVLAFIYRYVSNTKFIHHVVPLGGVGSTRCFRLQLNQRRHRQQRCQWDSSVTSSLPPTGEILEVYHVQPSSTWAPSTSTNPVELIVAVRVGQGSHLWGCQPRAAATAGLPSPVIISVFDSHREGDVSPLGREGGVCPGPHLGGAYRYLVIVVDRDRTPPHRGQ